MKTLIATILAAATLAAVPAGAKPVAEPGYKVSYHPQRDVYCVEVEPRSGVTLEPTIVGRSCHSETEWARWGLTFQRSERAVRTDATRVAQR